MKPIICSAILLTFTMTCSASADVVVPDAYYRNAVTAGRQGSPTDLSFQPTGGESTTANGAAASTQNDYNFPSISAQATRYGSDPYGTQSNAQSELAYYLEFVGADGDIQVLVQANGSATASGGGYAAAQLSIQSRSTGSSVLLEGISNRSPSNSFLIDDYYTFTANTVYQVYMYTQGLTQLSYDADQSAHAYVDPYFQGPDGYQLVLSDGIGNRSSLTSAVPEPSTWAMMMLGFAGLGAMTFRRRKSALLAA